MEFGLVESFMCDNGELDGQTPAQCFVLGYEFAVVCRLLEDFDSGTRQMVHSENIARITAAAAKRNRNVSFRFDAVDASESWVDMSWNTKSQ